jgi:hypothetical protein
MARPFQIGIRRTAATSPKALEAGRTSEASMLRDGQQGRIRLRRVKWG